MPQIFIDGKAVEAKDGQMIIEAALDAGMTIPHFCWHPGLSVAGNCRMCLVDAGMPKRDGDGNIEMTEAGEPDIMWGRKLAIACSTPVADGMYVRLEHPKVKEAQEAIMEFLLINHPLDCPICDEAGQCKLQEYAFRHSTGESRYDDVKNKKDKRRPLGPNVLFDGERCISCSRCIRFADEVAEQPVLTFHQRGDHVSIRTFPGEQFDSEYSMNVIDICPVGALTSPDFRFKARVWEMSFTDSICNGCSKGCNISVGVMNNEVLRLDPRTNMAVNEYWMCDTARLNAYKPVNENRIDKCLVNSNPGQNEVEWDEAYSIAANMLKSNQGSLVVVASPEASNESNFTATKFAAQFGARVVAPKYIDASFKDNKLHTEEMSPNVRGLQALGVTPKENALTELAADIKSGKVKAVVALEDDFNRWPAELVDSLDALDALIVCACNHSDVSKKAHVVLSTATWLESEGTFTNTDGRVQHFTPAVVTAENQRFMGMNMSRWDKFGAHNDRWTHGEKRHCRTTWRTLHQLLHASGKLDTKVVALEDVRSAMANEHSDFAGMTYAELKSRQGIVLGKAAEEEFVPTPYESHELKPF